MEHTTAAVAEIITANLPEGFTLDANSPTGGGCRAMEVRSPEGRVLLITDGDADLPFSAEDDQYDQPVVCFGYYDEDIEDGYLTIEADDNGEFAENIRTSIVAWVEGDPYRDEN